MRDTQGAAAILYAALTGRWPGAEPSAVAAAPYDGDRVCSPRQVRAGVPVDLDALVSATLGTARHGGGHVGEPVRTPAELARRLTSTAATSRIPVIEPLSEPHGDTPPPHSSGPYVAPYDDEGAPRAGRRSARLSARRPRAAGGPRAGRLAAVQLRLRRAAGSSSDPTSSTSSTPATEAAKLAHRQGRPRSTRRPRATARRTPTVRGWPSTVTPRRCGTRTSIASSSARAG